MNHDDIEKDQYDQIHGLAAELRELAGAVQTANTINGDLVKLLRRVLSGAFWVIVILVLALLYAANGPDGYKAVRDTLPHIPRNGDSDESSTASLASPIFPPPDPRAKLSPLWENPDAPITA